MSSAPWDFKGVVHRTSISDVNFYLGTFHTNCTNESTHVSSVLDLSTLYTTFPHNLIKDKLNDLIDRNALFTTENPKIYQAWSCQNLSNALTCLLDNICVRFGIKLYRQVVGITMGSNCAPMVANLFLFCYERDFMSSLSDDKQADIIDAFYTTSRYLDDILNINNVYFDNMVSQIYHQSSNLIKRVRLILKPRI